jgi:Trypsin
MTGRGHYPAMHRHVPALLLVAACATEPRLSEDSDAITDETAAAASAFHTARAIKTADGFIGGCTGTRISARFVMTAAHCLGEGMQAEIGNGVEFYNNGPATPAGSARIEQRYARPGINVDACFVSESNCYESNGDMADIALLRLSADTETDLEGPQATLAWSYPGAGSPGHAVGAGSHDGEDNPDGKLLQSSDELDSANDNHGYFETDEAQTDDGDSGGPFYVGSRVVGVLAGTAGAAGGYTGVPFHLNWILQKIGYVWRGQPSQENTTYVGNIIESSSTTELGCQYACEKTTACVAYNYRSNVKSCGLVSSVTSVNTQAGWRGALKYGRSFTSGDAVGYTRGDGFIVAVHAGTNHRVREIAWTGQWTDNDIHGNGPLVASRLSAIRRADGTNAIYYRGADSHLIEIALTRDWTPFDLTTLAGAPLAAGAPVAYVRADGITAVVYRALGSGNIIELRLGSRGWLVTDLTAATGAAPAWTDPSVSIRSDGVDSIVFLSGGHIWEIFHQTNGVWDWGVPSQLTSTAPPAPAATGRPVAFTHRDGINAIVYRSSADQIIELWNAGGQWQWGILATGAKGDPTAYLRTDNKEAVLFKNASGQIIEVANTATGWTPFNLTTITGAGAPATDPYVYHRKDGFNSILFEATGHVTEIWWKRGQAQWSFGDLTSQSGETP